jgi:hypothetical protein
MSATKSKPKKTKKLQSPEALPTQPPEIKDGSSDSNFLDLFMDDFIDAHAMVCVSCRVLEEPDEEDSHGAAVSVLRKALAALDELSKKLERGRVAYERGRQQGDAL